MSKLRAVYRELKLLIKHGPRYPWQRHIAPTRILRRDAIHTDTVGDVTVCVLTSRGDWLACLWSLVSFYELSGLRLPLLIYSDGTLLPKHISQLANLFPDARIMNSVDIEKQVSNALVDYPNCTKFRSAQPCARRLIDFPILCGSTFILMLDSDILFLRQPLELMKHIALLLPGSFVFERDMQDAYFTSRVNIQNTFNRDIAATVNCGIMLADVSAFEYSKIEEWLTQPGIENHPWAEQTLWAMYAGEERTVLLGEEYDVSMSAKIESDSVVKHYIKPIRDFMYTEGIPHLRSLSEAGRM